MDKHISLSPCPFCGMGLTLDIDEEGGVAILHSLKGEKNCWFPSIVEIEMPVETTLEEMVEILNRRPIQESFEHALVGTSVEAGKRRWEMSELKPCPFCGGVAQVNTWTMHGITESRCFCSNSDCPNSVRTVALEQWNTRPIEDALNARIAELEGKFDQLTARWRQERQDDKSSNDTQTQTIVYGKESEE